MKHLKSWGVLSALCLLAFPLLAQENELKLGSSVGKIGNVVDVSLTLSTDQEVQGLVAAFDWDAAAGTGAGLVVGAALADADVVVTRVEGSYMVLGVVMDNDGVGNEVIPPGADQVLATVQIECAGVEGSSALSFADGKYATVEGGPLLENIIVVGGLSIGSVEGLALTPGNLDCVPGFNRFYIDSATATSATGQAKVLLENIAPVEGYVVSLCHDDAALSLTDIVEGQAALTAQADFVADEITAGGGWIGVVIDLVEPFTNNTIPVGDANHIATFKYGCVGTPPVGQTLVVPLTFCNGTLGDPLKDNVIVVGGLSVDPVLEDGTFTCSGVLPPAENCTNGIDDNGNGLIDCDDPECKDIHPACISDQTFYCGTDPDGLPGNITEVAKGASSPVCFYILNPEDNAAGDIAQFDHIQGFSMAMTFCCDVMAGDTLDISGTILEAIGAEYVAVDPDNDPNDGDGCELVIGVLVDALPPFDGATIPPSNDLQRMGCVEFTARDTAPCGQTCPIDFTDGVNGTGKVPVYNLVSVENVARGVKWVSCGIKISEEERFFRGDCNFSGGVSPDGSMAVNIADAAAVVSFLFLPGPYKYAPPCLDACDCNNDGRIDLADTVCILRYLFQNGPFPPLPGPGLRETGLPNPDNVEPTGPGPDPVKPGQPPDLLDCKAGRSCS